MPSRLKFDTLNEYHAALDQVIQHAGKKLHIFDFNLADGGYNSAQRFQLIQDFLLASRSNRLIFILHDTSYLSKQCPRIMTLLTRFSHAISIRQMQEHAKRICDTFAIADDRHYVHRFHYEYSQGVFAMDDVQGCMTFAQRFSELEQTSDEALPPTTLGL